MPRVLHVIVTANFAGAERYVCDVATQTADRGWQVTVVGGHPVQMGKELGDRARWLAGANLAQAAASVLRSGRHDVCHMHMTYAEAVGVATRPIHRGALITTRHFAQHRGSTRAGQLVAPLLSQHLECEVAISDFVASRLERRPAAVIHNGVRRSPLRWTPHSRSVLMVQRLEREKDTAVGIRAWALSGLAEQGWRLRIVGRGSQRSALESLIRDRGIPGVEFAGWSPDVASHYDEAGILLATAPAEPFGLAVVEAMAAGIPVVAAAGGGHLETWGTVPGASLFSPGDAEGAAQQLTRLGCDSALREALSGDGRAVQRRRFDVCDQTGYLLGEYTRLMRGRRGVPKASAVLARTSGREDGRTRFDD